MESGAVEPAGPIVAPASRSADLRAIHADGIFYSAMVGAGESYLAAFALALGFGDVFAGLIATLPLSTGAILQLLNPIAVRRLRSHRRWVVLCARLQALSFLPLAVSAVAGVASAPLLFGCAAAYWGFGMAASPAWNTWVTTLVPAEIRAEYFARRTRWSQASLVLALVMAGLLLEFGSELGERGTSFAVLFAFAAAARLVSARFIASQSERPWASAAPAKRSATEVLRVLRGSTGARILLHVLAMQVAVYLAAPFFVPYMLGPLALGYAEFTALTAMAFVGRILALLLLGRIFQRLGVGRLLLLGAIGIVPLPILWLVSDSFVYLIALQLVAGAAWAAFDLASLMAVFDQIEERDRTTVLTWFNLASAAAIVSGSLVGAALFDAVGPGSLAFASVFVASAALRGLALLAFRDIGRLPRIEALPELRTVGIRPGVGGPQRPITATLPNAAPPAEERSESVDPKVG